MWTKGEDYKIILFYRYVIIENVQETIDNFRQQCDLLGIVGRILVSKEGINGTLAGSCPDIDQFIAFMNNDSRFQHIDWKTTFIPHGEHLAFPALSIREVPEIISCGTATREFIDSNIQFKEDTFGGIEGTGVHLTPSEWHKMLQETSDYILLDIRNDFEYDIGHFEKAMNIGTFVYSETFHKLDEVLSLDKEAGSKETKEAETPVEEPPHQEEKKVFMYCTGGIRCEKASAYLKAKGLKNVYQLQGGIHRYLEAYPDGGKFLGKNFVFDSRVSVGPTAHEGDVPSAPVAEAEVAQSSSSSSAPSTVVGRCIDCHQSHDRYSGFIVCTVCRMPVLVCPTCVQANPHPGEYYCARHRDLKGVYFTVLERFTTKELLEQKNQLQKLLEHCLETAKQVRAVTNPKRKQKRNHPNNNPANTDNCISEKTTEEANQEEDQNTKKEEKSSVPSVDTLPPSYEYSQNRRRTLRRQIDRIDSLLKVKADHEIEFEREQKEMKPVGGEDLINPKVRYGWGFWRD